MNIEFSPNPENDHVFNSILDRIFEKYVRIEVHKSEDEEPEVFWVRRSDSINPILDDDEPFQEEDEAYAFLDEHAINPNLN